MKTQRYMVRPAEGKPVMIDGGTPLRIVSDLIRKAGGVLIRWPGGQRAASETLLLEYRGKAVLTPFGLIGKKKTGPRKAAGAGQNMSFIPPERMVPETTKVTQTSNNFKS